MLEKVLYKVFFSPTQTSRVNMENVISGMKAKNEVLWDCTYKKNTDIGMIPPDAVAIFSVPVYGGKVPPLALERMADVRGNDTPAILLVTYGNRDFEGALTQLADFVKERGFLPIAAGAYIGEHSYSNACYPIATNRPDVADRANAILFGERIVGKIISVDNNKHIGIDLSHMPVLSTPFWDKLRFVWFVLGYRRKQKKNPIKIIPTTDLTLCTSCDTCLDVCPNDAIDSSVGYVTDSSRCIRCCACVKKCPVDARLFNSPFAPALANYFKRRREPVTYL